jgi:ferritin-like metal-binding protein YciE
MQWNEAQAPAFPSGRPLEIPMKTLADAFEHTLQDVYFAENAIVKVLPKVIDAVTNGDLKSALKDHLTETKGQIETLQAVFKSIGKKASGEKCDAIEGLIKETEDVIEQADGSVAKHAAIIGCCQAVEHYEIARYGTLREWAKALGESEAHDLLSEILDQEKAANHKLTHIAITTINKAA